MKPLLSAAALAALLAVTPAFAQTGKPNATDRSFIDKVARDGRAEVELGKLAQQKAASPDVKSLAARLVTDHSKANQQLMSIAQQEGVKPPSGIGKENTELRSRLEKLNGQAFDRAYVQAQVKDHQKDIQYLQRQADAVQNPELKSFIQQAEPVMQQHLQMAQQIENQMASSGASNAPRTR